MPPAPVAVPPPPVVLPSPPLAIPPPTPPLAPPGFAFGDGPGLLEGSGLVSGSATLPCVRTCGRRRVFGTPASLMNATVRALAFVAAADAEGSVGESGGASAVFDAYMAARKREVESEPDGGTQAGHNCF